MSYKELIEFLTQNFDKFLSWKFLAFFDFSMLLLYLYGKINGMNIINTTSWLHWSSFALFTLSVYKLLYDGFMFFYNKNLTKKERTKKYEYEQKILSQILSLPYEESIRLNFIFSQPSYCAFFPKNDLYILILKKKNIIQQIENSQREFDIINNCSAFQVSQDIIKIINKHQQEIFIFWNKIKNKKKMKQFRSYQ